MRTIPSTGLFTLVSITTLAAIVGCGGASSGDPGTSDPLQQMLLVEPKVEQVVFKSRTEIKENPPPNVNVTVTDGVEARAIYDALLALPAFPGVSGTTVTSCPFDNGNFYTLEFLDAAGASVAKTNLDAEGCETANIETTKGTSLVLWAATDDGFWKTLATNLGVPERKIKQLR